MNECIPVILCIDIEPDLQCPDPTKSQPWRGFERLYSYLQEFRLRVADTKGKAARLNWFWLLDPRLSWFFRPQSMVPSLSQSEIPVSYLYLQEVKETAEQLGVPYLIVLLPLKPGSAWGFLPARLTQDAVRYLDLSLLSDELTTEEFVASRFSTLMRPLRFIVELDKY